MRGTHQRICALQGFKFVMIGLLFMLISSELMVSAGAGTHVYALHCILIMVYWCTDYQEQ